MRYTKITIPAGAAKPFEALHISDTHLLFADGRDNPDKYAIAMRRYGEYEYTNVGRNLPYFLDALNFAKERNIMLLHTGDLIDFVSEQNLEVAQKLLELAGVDYLMCAGNHEYTNYSGQHPETKEEIELGRKLVPGYFRNDLFFASRIVNGINFLAVDNGNYQFQETQLELLKKEIAKKLPVVLLIHNPLYTPDLLQKRLAEKPVGKVSLANCPPEMCTPEAKNQGYAADDTTKGFLDLLRKSGLLRAVLAGHIHLHTNSDVVLWDDVHQYVAGGGYYGCGELIRFI